MISPVSPQNNFCVSSFKKCTHSKNTLRVSQAALCALTVLSAGVSLEGCIRSSLSPWVYLTSYTTLGLSLLGIAIIFNCKPMAYIPQTASLLTPEEIRPLILTSLMHELCEMYPDGTFKPCTIEHLKEIVVELEHRDALNALNNIPEYYLNKPRSLFSLSSTFYTPLQYWASQGNLPAVELLMQHGAVDYPTLPEDTNNSSRMTSALYAATLAGHAPVVSYLLRHEAQPSIAFNQNLLASFIPKLIFELCQKVSFHPLITPERQAPFEGLEQVLQYLASYQSDNLQLQLKVPIYPEKNSLEWVETLDQGPEREQLLEILTRFGALKDNVLSNDELAAHGNIGSGFTLQEISSFKN